MSSTVVHQDYIARIRYSNQLPPPPNPPKLLDIPGTGLSGGHYTGAGYASRLAREQPLNIDADAELGMPIDLVGIPGIFDGDETAIMARPAPTSIHPSDKALLKPLSALSKGNSANTGVSFLRRTEYAASSQPQMFASSTSTDLLRLRNDPKRKRNANVDKENPINIVRHITKGFDIAYPQDAYRGEDTHENVRGAAVTDAEVMAWSNPVHPSKPELKLLDSYPVLPDLEAIPTTGFYYVFRFNANPVAVSDRYDERLDTALLRPVQDEEVMARLRQREADHDPNSGKPRPIGEFDYDYYLPSESTAVRGIKRKLDVTDPEKDDPDLYAHDGPDGERVFKYNRLRTYETQNQHGDPENLYNDTVALTLHDPETEVGAVPGVKKRLAKAAYFYPVMSRTTLRPKRNVGPISMSQVEEQKIEELNITVRDLGEEELPSMLAHRIELDASLDTRAAMAVEAAG